MSSMEMSAEYAAELRQMLHEGAASRVNGEEVIAAGAFRHGGAAATMAVSKAQLGALAYAGVKLFRKKKAGGLPERVALVLTPERLYAFDLGLKAGGREVRLKDEAAAWDRGGLQTSTEVRSGMTALTLESPVDGELATLVAIGVRDDPVSQELIGALQGTVPEAS
jgi:hypothetical protein